MSRRWFPRAIGLPLLLLIGVAYPQAQPEQAAAPPAQASQASVPAEQATLNRYCAGCHNEKAKQGNFALSTLDVANVGPDAEKWELVVRKLRARSMPPAGRPRPTEAAYDGLVAHLETSLDRVAAVNPDPGRTDTFRRLNRTRRFCRATTRAMGSTTSASAACLRCCSSDICRRRRKSAALP